MKRSPVTWTSSPLRLVGLRAPAPGAGGLSLPPELPSGAAAALLNARQWGPAGIYRPKRDWTTAMSAGWATAWVWAWTDASAPPFPFPLPLLRLALECSDDGLVNRFVAGGILRHVWRGGADATRPGRLDAARLLAEQLRRTGPRPNAAKQLLRVTPSWRRSAACSACHVPSGRWPFCSGAWTAAHAACLSRWGRLVCATLGSAVQACRKGVRVEWAHANAFNSPPPRSVPDGRNSRWCATTWTLPTTPKNGGAGCGQCARASVRHHQRAMSRRPGRGGGGHGPDDCFDGRAWWRGRASATLHRGRGWWPTSWRARPSRI